MEITPDVYDGDKQYYVPAEIVSIVKASGNMTSKITKNNSHRQQSQD